MKHQNDNRFIDVENPNFWLAIFITALLITLQAFGENAITLFRYESNVTESGEWWRLLSGHFIHLSWMHLTLNLAGLWILHFIFNRIRSPITGLISIIILAVGISSGLLIFSPNIGWYVGFSGILHGLIVIGALASFQYEPRTMVLLLAGVSLKLLWEQFFADANAMESTIGGAVIYDAHLYGAITGVLIAIAIKFLHRSNCNIEGQTD